jgi:hypothetical protein
MTEARWKGGISCFAFISILLLSAGAEGAQWSLHSVIWFDVISGGGGEGASTGYSSFGTLGQPSPVGPSSSAHHANHAGWPGAPVDATISMTCSIYDVEIGGTALWSEMRSVTVKGGI